MNQHQKSPDSPGRVRVQRSSLAGSGAFRSPHLGREAHVLVLDDTWAGGGHAQSAAGALKMAGASNVSVMVLARWVRLDYGDNLAWARRTLTRDFDADTCPFTGGDCP